MEALRFLTVLVGIPVEMEDLKEASSVTMGIPMRGTDVVPHALWRIITPVPLSLPFWGTTIPLSAAILAWQT